jgi:flagellar secretion chaperone FliS
MLNNKPYKVYKEQSVLTATPGELIGLLLSAEVKNIKKAIISIKDNDIPSAHENLVKAQDIIDELIISLDLRYEISNQLEALYNFIKKTLIEANVKKDIDKLISILPIVSELRDSFIQAEKLFIK